MNFCHALWFLCCINFSSGGKFYTKINNNYKLKIDHTFLMDLHFLWNGAIPHRKFTEIKTLGNKNDCNPHACLPWPVCKTSVMLKTLRWHQNEGLEKSAQCGYQLWCPKNWPYKINNSKFSHKFFAMGHFCFACSNHTQSLACEGEFL